MAGEELTVAGPPRQAPGRFPAALAALGLLGTACVTVAPGQAAVVTGLGGVEGPLGEGVHLVSPAAVVRLLDLRQQEHDDDLKAVTADGAAVEAGTSLVTYRLAPEELVAFTREVGDDVYRVAIGPVVSAHTRRVLGRLRLDQLDTAHLREAQRDITAAAAADLRPLHVLLESVDLRQVTPLSARVQAQFEALAVLEQRVAGVPDRLRLARQAADARRERAAGVAAAHRELAPTLDAATLAARRAHAFQQLLQSPSTSVVVGGGVVPEVSP